MSDLKYLREYLRAFSSYAKMRDYTNNELIDISLEQLIKDAQATDNAVGSSSFGKDYRWALVGRKFFALLVKELPLLSKALDEFDKLESGDE